MVCLSCYIVNWASPSLCTIDERLACGALALLCFSVRQEQQAFELSSSSWRKPTNSSPKRLHRCRRSSETFGAPLLLQFTINTQMRLDQVHKNQYA